MIKMIKILLGKIRIVDYDTYYSSLKDLPLNEIKKRIVDKDLPEDNFPQNIVYGMFITIQGLIFGLLLQVLTSSEFKFMTLRKILCFEAFILVVIGLLGYIHCRIYQIKKEEKRKLNILKIVLKEKEDKLKEEILSHEK